METVLNDIVNIVKEDLKGKGRFMTINWKEIYTVARELQGQKGDSDEIWDDLNEVAITHLEFEEEKEGDIEINEQEINDTTIRFMWIEKATGVTRMYFDIEKLKDCDMLTNLVIEGKDESNIIEMYAHRIKFGWDDNSNGLGELDKETIVDELRQNVRSGKLESFDGETQKTTIGWWKIIE